MAEISIDPSAVSTPASRFKTVGKYINDMHDRLRDQVDGAAANTESAEVRAGCDMFTAAIQAALQAYSSSAARLGTRLRQANVRYENADGEATLTTRSRNPKTRTGG